MIQHIDPLTRLGSRLLEVEKPARYTGGEYGVYAKKGILRAAIVFPDLYELGMSNHAFRIIYNGLNLMEGISCDRAFAPAPDFEKLLSEEDLPLYGLDTGIALSDTDLLLFTLGYELGITGILSVLDCSRVALRSADRGPRGPIVIMGGPCVSNPLPYSLFVDAFWIGEAEAGFFDLAAVLLEMKKSGAARSDLLGRIKDHPHVWAPGKTGVRRAVHAGFGGSARLPAVFPVSGIRTVQHHGAVEIMRGCPNGCRFCHAGFWYRPMRQKHADLVLEEVEAFVKLGGYREISLSSLSSGDYCRIDSLIDALNSRYNGRNISFQLPSLRVTGFSLPLLAKISEVRKSGLTFAVETPAEADQLSINKKAVLDEVISIIRESKKYGWKGIKFYFMIGLPLDTSEEEKLIVDFILEAGKMTGSRFHINAGTFVPKPHTPYQRSAQLDEDTAWQKLHYIQDKLKPRGHKVSAHNPFLSVLEGVFSRGTENAGILAETAYKQGCRLDAWSDYINIPVWKSVLNGNSPLAETFIRGREKTEALPWEIIHSGVGEGYLNNEQCLSERHVFTPPCVKKCAHVCGICGAGTETVDNTIQCEVVSSGNGKEQDVLFNKTAVYRMLFLFSKDGPGVFTPHLGVIEIFSAAIIRSGLPARYSEGFNPLLKIDFASPAPVGLTCAAETACIDFKEAITPEKFILQLNKALPKGFAITKAELYTVPAGEKKYSPASVLWGFRYGEKLVPFKDEKEYRHSVCNGKNCFGLTRDGVLAKKPNTGEPVDYFELYTSYYSNP